MAASSSSSSHRERPIEERFERAVAVIRSLPQDGTSEQLDLFWWLITQSHFLLYQ